MVAAFRSIKGSLDAELRGNDAMTESGLVCGIHRTELKPDGSGYVSKKMLGTSKGDGDHA